MASMITRSAFGERRSSRSAVSPSTPGIQTSINTTPGRCFAAAVIASPPSPASPTTSMSAAGSRIIPDQPAVASHPPAHAYDSPQAIRAGNRWYQAMRQDVAT